MSPPLSIGESRGATSARSLSRPAFAPGSSTELVRVSGKTKAYDVGFLEMKTEQQGATPSNNYLVGRAKRNFMSSSWIGGLVTSRDSELAGDYNRVYGTDAHFQFFQKLEKMEGEQPAVGPTLFPMGS